MELVYLWVEDYKNIHKQGFNFSPRFTCEYDDEKNELTIDENDDYIENFFGDNINVTAIVGKNGSGKSSILEYLFLKNNSDMNQNYICIYSFDNLLIIDKYQHSIKIYTNLIYRESLEKIAYDNSEIKMIFSFAEHMKPYNHKKSHEKENFIMLGAVNIIYEFPENKFNKLLEKLDFYKYQNAEKKKKKGESEEVFHLDNIKYRDLSFGEKLFISLFIQISQKIDKNKLNILFLDEITLAFHPNWEKKVIEFLIKIFQNDNIHFIISSHSPFLLSDIPKQNIIFLDKDENGNCKVVDGLKEKKQTFGANIHTLLSDSFFMEDGLMGEFAKSKIDEVIRLLNKDKLDEKELKYCEQIISIIGEPIVKNQLQRMLDSKRLKKVDEIDAIKKSMEAMQQRLDELEK